uniref:GrpE protein homolog n=1 Tax=Rhabditophanes sp. KR3021 TaxID=114890 RepID=A0AC35U058_9BILA
MARVLCSPGKLVHNTSPFSTTPKPENGESPPFNFVINEDGKRKSAEQYIKSVKDQLTAEDKTVIPEGALQVIGAEYDAVLKEIVEMKDKYLRSVAETENVRKRGMRLTEDAKIFAIQGFCKDLLEVADILNLAIDACPKDKVDTDKNVKQLHDGITMTKTVLLKTFAKHGLVPINPQGAKFDPSIHEAVFQVPKEYAKVGADHIDQVAKIGYSLHGRPIRAAQVGVVASD